MIGVYLSEVSEGFVLKLGTERVKGGLSGTDPLFSLKSLPTGLNDTVNSSRPVSCRQVLFTRIVDRHFEWPLILGQSFSSRYTVNTWQKKLGVEVPLSLRTSNTYSCRKSMLILNSKTDNVSKPLIIKIHRKLMSSSRKWPPTFKNSSLKEFYKRKRTRLDGG